MRILQVVHGFPPREWAGVEVVAYYLAKGLQAQGHEVTIFCREQDLARAEGRVREEKYDGLRVVYAVNNFPAPPVFRSYYDNPRFDAIFTDLLRQVNPHGVHFQHLIGHSPSLVRLAEQAGYPTILSLHDYYYLCHRVQLLTSSGTLCDGPARGERCIACLNYLQAGDDARHRFSYMGEVLATPRLILSPSAFLRDRYLQHYPFLADRLRVLPHGVRVVGKEDRKSSTPPLHFLYLGALLPHKGVHLILQALRGLPPGTAEVVICGHAPQGAEAYREHLLQEAEGLPVRFAGPYGPAALPQVLAQGDVVVAPSMWDEAFALVVHEAFGAGLPVIASRLGALPEAVQDGVNGLLFPPGNVEALRETMLRCVTDSELLTCLHQGVPPVKGIEEYVTEMEAVYLEVFHEAPATPEKEPPETALSIESQAVEGKTATETTQPLVSIVIPAYNHAPYLAETIDSVLWQTYQNWELIIIDDGSTDATPEIMQRYTDPRIRAYRQENRGLSATLNRGIKLARGKYFAFLPSDDVYEPDKLAVQVPVLEENPAVGVVFSWQTVIDAEGKPSTEQHVQEWFTVSFETKEEIFPALFERDFLSTPTHLLRLECFARVGRFDESLVTAQDYDLWLRILQYYDVRLLKRPLVKMRWHGQNQTRVATSHTELERATVLLKAFRTLAIEEIFPSLASIAADTYPEAFAHTYLTLARHVMRSGLSEMVPVARLYLAQALRYQTQLKIPPDLQPLIATSPGLHRQTTLVKTGNREKLEGQPALPLLAGDAADFAPARGKNREKINVLVEVPTLDKGGVEQVVFAMVSALPKETFRFLIVSVDGGGYMAEHCRRHGIPVEVLRGNKETAYRELLERYHADLVVTHYSHFGLPIACQMDIPVVTFVHGIYAWFRAGLLGEMGGWDQYITRYVAISQDVADYLTYRFHIPPEKVCVIHNGIEIADTWENGEEVSRADWGLRPEDYVFLNVAAISPTKGHFVLLEALRRVAPTYPEVKVLCVGQVLDEEYFQRVLAKRRRDQLEDRLIFAGFHPQVAPFYRLADAFVFPSVLEGFGLAKLEAMAQGLPLILTRVGDSDKLIARSDIGLLIPNSYADLYDLDQNSVMTHLTDESPANAADLAAAMEEFVTHREHWRTAGQQGREKVLRHFTQGQALKSYEALFLREVFLDQRKRAEAEERVETHHLRDQIFSLERVLQEKDHVLQEKDHVLQEKDHVLQEKDHVLQEKGERITALTRQVERQQEQLTTQQRVVDQYLRELQRLSLTIFDRLDVTKRLREFRSRLYWGVRRRVPRPVKRIAKALSSRVSVRQSEKVYSIRWPVPPPSRNASSAEIAEKGYEEHMTEVRQQLSRPAPAPLIKQAAEVLSQARCRGVILYPPTLKWTEVLFQRPHQMLRALAAQGYLCVYGTPDPAGDEVDGFRQIEEWLFLCSDIRVFQALNGPDLILWLSRADHRAVCDFLPQALVVYDIIDDLEVFHNYCATFQRDHDRLLREADLVTVTAEALLRDVRKIRGDALFVPNGVRLEDFARSGTMEVPAELKSLMRSGRPIVGFYGALAPWLDYDLIEYAARQCPDLAFVFIGPDYEGGASRLTRHSNLHWLGPKAYSALRSYASVFQVTTIPFQVNKITRAASPIKLFEYMALGKPIVSTALPECRRYRSVLIAENPDDYVRKLRQALELGEDAAYSAMEAEEAAANTWEQRARVCATRLQGLLGRPGIPVRAAEQRGAAGTSGLQRSRSSANAVVKGEEKIDIICFPIIDWYFRYQRPQQILSRLAQKGHRIFYVQTTFTTATSLVPARSEIEQNLAFHPLAENVWSVTLTTPRLLNLYRDAIIGGGVLSLLSRSLEALREKAGIAETLLYVHLPFWRPLVEAYRRRFGGNIVYDCMDNHRGFSTNTSQMCDEEEALAVEADLVIVSATSLFRQFAHLGEKVILVRNGADFAHFHAAQPAPALAQLAHPIVGYYGAISEWFDTGLIAAAARKHPEWNFVLIGDTFGADIRLLQGLANVHLLGEKPYTDISEYLQCFDVCCIPFHITDLTRATDPVKFYEYLSAGKPVVATPLPELATFADVFYCASDEEEFVNKIEAALQENSPALVQQRIDIAQANDWRQRVEAIEKRLPLLQKKVSVIVLTYNNLDCTRLCLDSLYRSSAYKNWELIIVDNNSSDGTAEYLRQFTASHHNVSLILNPTNVGFARGNNQGVAAASGEIIILLNNDVVVTHGWMGKMVAYLARPEIGLVGPVTNTIDNEAKVNLGYTDLAQMPQAAVAYMQTHQGQCFEIKVLAAFCLGMRRTLVDEIGLLDERFEIGMFEDDDYSRRVREKGYRVVCARDIFIHHVGGASFFKLPRNEYLRIFNANKTRYEEKWGEVWEPHKHVVVTNDGDNPQSSGSKKEARKPAPVACRELQFPKLLEEHFQVGRLDKVVDPAKRMWIEFALSTNKRGQAVADELERYTGIRGKKFLDAGCAYGGFLVAFTAKGAERVVGIDINPNLLRLAAANLEDCNLSASLHLRDLLDPEILELGRFDIITCNDVIEHVKDPQRAIAHLSLLLEDAGFLYMEIPNRYFVGFIKEDGHYRLPGITLLPRQRAARYYQLNFEGLYDVGFYRKLGFYFYHLGKRGLSPTLLNKEPERFDPSVLDGVFLEALRSFDSFQGKQIEPALAEEIRAKGKRLYEIFTREVQAYQVFLGQDPKRARDLARRIHLRYGVDFWRVIAKK